jgi:hypothetical protein
MLLRERWNRRRLPGLTVAVVLLACGGAAATTGVFHIASGRVSSGTYYISRAPASTEHGGGICLELAYAGRSPEYGCGQPPTLAKPFGVVVADSLGGSRVQIIYGLVSADILRVDVVGAPGHRGTDRTTSKAGLPGRFFSLVVPAEGQIELVGYGATGDELARIGSRARPIRNAESKEDAVAQGDPAGFTPAVPLPTSFSYEGKAIPANTAARDGLACAQDRDGVHCYDSVAAMTAAHARHPSAAEHKP